MGSLQPWPKLGFLFGFCRVRLNFLFGLHCARVVVLDAFWSTGSTYIDANTRLCGSRLIDIMLFVSTIVVAFMFSWAIHTFEVLLFPTILYPDSFSCPGSWIRAMFGL